MSDLDWTKDWVNSKSPEELYDLSHGHRPKYDDYTGEFLGED